MKMSAEGRKLLIHREGVRLKAYRDSVGVLTIGVGHTSAAGPPAVTPGLTITPAQCEEIFARDLVQYENAVSRAVTVPVSQNEFDAMVSLCYNIGTGGFAHSSVVRRLNAGDRRGAAQAFMMWNKPPEIIGRRTTEQQQFLGAGPGEIVKATPIALPAPAEKPSAPPLQQGKHDGWFATLLAALGAAIAAAYHWFMEYLPEIMLGLGALIVLALICFRLTKGRWPWTGHHSNLSLPASPQSSAASSAPQLSARLAALSALSPAPPSPPSSVSRRPRKRSAPSSRAIRQRKPKSKSSRPSTPTRSSRKRRSRPKR